jgi:hypothetical protein
MTEKMPPEWIFFFLNNKSDLNRILAFSKNPLKNRKKLVLGIWDGII